MHHLELVEAIINRGQGSNDTAGRLRDALCLITLTLFLHVNGDQHCMNAYDLQDTHYYMYSSRLGIASLGKCNNVS